MTEQGWNEQKELKGLDPHRRALILRGPHGFFRFDALVWRKYYEPSEEDDGPIDGGWWDCDHQSGLYATIEETEKEARLALPWLQA